MNETILVGDDELSSRSFARDALQAHGYSVLDSDEPQEALQILRDQPVHLPPRHYQRNDRARRKSWVVVVRWQGARELKIVHTEQDAKALVQMIHKQELAGINVLETIRQARVRAAGTPVPDSVPFPALREGCRPGSSGRSGPARSA